MNLLDAHAMLFADGDRELLADLPKPTWSLMATAAVVLAGRLDEAENLEDLHEGIKHFEMLWGGGIVSEDDWCDQARHVKAMVDQFGDEFMAAARAELRRRVENN